MPGIQDGHMHPLSAGQSLTQCSLEYKQLTLDQMRDRISVCLDATKRGRARRVAARPVLGLPGHPAAGNGPLEGGPGRPQRRRGPSWCTRSTGIRRFAELPRARDRGRDGRDTGSTGRDHHPRRERRADRTPRGLGGRVGRQPHPGADGGAERALAPSRAPQDEPVGHHVLHERQLGRGARWPPRRRCATRAG